jgi:UDP-N-acetyl-D-galactosamine dehydrogenase
MGMLSSNSAETALADKNIAVIGLGYVGLPLAVEFGKKFSTIGFDINQERLAELNRGEDSTLEVTSEGLTKAKLLSFSSNLDDIQACDIYIITVPTPINEHNQPDLSPLIGASEMVSKVLSSGNIVIYESTVYPGATEEVCVPVLEKVSKLTMNNDFYVGYSPERINPGDKLHTLTKILKVTSGSNQFAGDIVDLLYSTIIDAGTYKASSIKVAEAAKVIENTQRDVNIGLINELAIIFDKLNIDTEEVLLAAGTKWNFLPFRPGLVGGHCIGVDPYYLTHKAQAAGLHPEIILAGRRINDNMAAYVTSKLIKEMLRKNIRVKESRVLILGFTFKENCPDVRNTKVIDMVKELKEYGISVDCYDPWVDPVVVANEYSLDPIESPLRKTYDAVVIAVGHDHFKEMGINRIKEFCKSDSVIFDLKYLFSQKETDIRL